MSAQIYELSPGVRVADSWLSDELATARKFIGLQSDDNSVIASPMLEEYEPQIFLNDAMQLGRQGIDDFGMTFAFDGLNTSQLMTLYSGFKEGLRTRRKQSPQFHKFLGQIAGQWKMETPALSRTSIHDTEDLVIGYVAARCATKRSTSSQLTMSQQERIPAKAAFAAEKRPKHDTRTYRQERTTVMRHFALSAPQLKPRVLDIMRAARD